MLILSPFPSRFDWAYKKAIINSPKIIEVNITVTNNDISQLMKIEHNEEGILYQGEVVLNKPSGQALNLSHTLEAYEKAFTKMFEDDIIKGTQQNLTTHFKDFNEPLLNHVFRL